MKKTIVTSLLVFSVFILGMIKDLDYVKAEESSTGFEITEIGDSREIIEYDNGDVVIIKTVTPEEAEVYMGDDILFIEYPEGTDFLDITEVSIMRNSSGKKEVGLRIAGTLVAWMFRTGIRYIKSNYVPASVKAAYATVVAFYGTPAAIVTVGIAFCVVVTYGAAQYNKYRFSHAINSQGCVQYGGPGTIWSCPRSLKPEGCAV